MSSLRVEGYAYRGEEFAAFFHFGLQADKYSVSVKHEKPSLGLVIRVTKDRI